jgi:hypothetical protein
MNRIIYNLPKFYLHSIDAQNLKLFHHNFKKVAKCNYLKLKEFMAQKLICKLQR